jgi:lipoate-protein ligase B
MPTVEPVTINQLGRVPFREAWDIQQRTHARVAAGSPLELIYCSHPPVYTLGRQTLTSHLPLERPRLEALGAETVEIDRGGSVTFHGPGQVIGYPIFDLGRLSCGRDLHLFLRGLEAALMSAVATFGVSSWRVEGKTGIWTERGKLAAIGLKCSRWVTMHGFALNLDQDLGWFNHVIPCGLHEPVTSMAELLGPATPARSAVEAAITRELCAEFGLEVATSQAGKRPNGS